ncbi:alpha/beta hydrolase [Mycobacteroides abscessus]|uniref:AB hydrolase-1 domain-containing protein n=7 Tax=Mycobacteroides abscessus TaxID=36809 RepID=B1MNV1_MYCA9|nr:alpha/beta hydrolase [Mycobacteroides abscessus]ALM16288.1 hydrolase [Mycobacteroides abscessus]AMU45460.1 hydrolase [Mycobacteroides abscessus]AMU50353.1 hydrolase [Mycobacteroides abscessus]AMU70105.1 hydrolase [Mycobacteroides abscessus]ANO09033.1 hydrolase [Mycobacteroides abscessus]
MMRMRRALPVIFLMLTAAVPAIPAAAAPLPAPSPSLQAFYDQKVVWGGCDSFVTDTSRIPTARCAKVKVPVNYDKLMGAVAELAVLRVPATGKRVGALLVNPGGPGGSGVDLAAGMGAKLGDSAIGQSFDIVGFDPRGVGGSTPTLRCRTDAEFDAFRKEPLADYSQAGVAHIEDVYRQYVNECANRMGLDFLANAGTASAARDMDIVRSIVGAGAADTRLNYLGYSYGTELGTQYAEYFPQNVRTMVLDGAIDPTIDPVESNVRQMTGFQVAFNDYAADCAKDPKCPLGPDPSQAVKRFHQLIDPLVTKPAKTNDPRGLSYQDAITGTIQAMYTPRYWKYLTSGLSGLADGSGPDDLLWLADQYQERDDHGRYDNLQDAFNSIRCVDGPTPKDSAPWVAADKTLREQAPFSSYGSFTGYAPRDMCAFWPVPPTSTPHTPSTPGLAPVVVISTTHDPATPYEAGVALARQLGGSLISYEGTQHTVAFNGEACVDDVVTRYFVDGTVPPKDVRC